MAQINSFRRDFEVFKKGIQRLEELKAELDSLNTRGFESEANSIRAKLKNVSDIPLIEIELKRLKQKISGKYKPKERRKSNSRIIKLEKEVFKLEEELKRKNNLCKSQGANNEKYTKEIPKLRAQISELRAVLGQHKREEERKKDILKRIDPTIDVVSSDLFELSINEIKAKISDELRKKQTDMQKQLQEDLESREKNFKKKYEDKEKKNKVNS